MRIGSIVERKMLFPPYPPDDFKFRNVYLITLFISILLSYSFFISQIYVKQKKPVHFIRIGFIVF